MRLAFFELSKPQNLLALNSSSTISPRIPKFQNSTQLEYPSVRFDISCIAHVGLLNFLTSLPSNAESFLVKGECSYTVSIFSVALSKLWRSSLPWSLRVKKNAQIEPKYSAKSHLTRVAGSSFGDENLCVFLMRDMPSPLIIYIQIHTFPVLPL
jgi:hypothetical protein